jgi:hypothetical protein
MGALRVAAETYATSDEFGFLAWLQSNENEAATPAQRLFAHAMSCVPERYASRALKFLMDDPNRFHIGSTEDLSGTTKRLVRSVSPFWHHEELELFEHMVLAYTPSPRPGLTPKDRQHFHSYIRQLKLELLSALPTSRVSLEVQRYIAEERRRFPDDRFDTTLGGFIGSPIPAQSLSRASDDDILNAFRTLPDATGWHHPRSWHTGGNIQLSREFANFAKEDPARAGRLIRRFEPRFGTRRHRLCSRRDGRNG